MNKLKRYTIIGFIFVLAAGILSHFVYDWSGNNFIIGFFFPTSESTWEHMKLCFFPMLLYSIYMSIKVRWDYPCVTSSLLFGTLLGTFLIPAIFYMYTGILGKNFLILDIVTFEISVLVAFAAVYRLTQSCKLAPWSPVIKVLVVIMVICFLMFTYCPPGVEIFRNPTRH